MVSEYVFMVRLGQATVVDPADMEGLQKALDAQQCTLFFSESPTNPYLRCIDVELVSKMCHAKDCIVCIDGTFATPINQRAIAQGADLVLHSATKYIAGELFRLLPRLLTSLNPIERAQRGPAAYTARWNGIGRTHRQLEPPLYATCHTQEPPARHTPRSHPLLS